MKALALLSALVTLAVTGVLLDAEVPAHAAWWQASVSEGTTPAAVRSCLTPAEAAVGRRPVDVAGAFLSKAGSDSPDSPAGNVPQPRRADCECTRPPPTEFPGIETPRPPCVMFRGRSI
jgi:hypothetical protein